MRREYDVSLLPSGYTAVEYIESTGTQYIKTLFYPNKNYKFSAKVAMTQQDRNTIYFGTRWYGNYVSLNSQCYLNNNKNGVDVDNMYIHLYSTSTTDHVNNWNSGIIPALNVAYELKNMTCTNTMTTANYPMYIFALNNLGQTTIAGTSRIYYLSAKVNDANVFNFIPAVRNSDGKPGLYDLCGSICPLTGTPFYVNAGTGEFLFG